MAEEAARQGMERRGLASPRVRGALAALALVGCAGEAPRPVSPTSPEPSPSPSPTPAAAPAASADATTPASSAPATSAPAQGFPPAKLGEMCGGFAGIACASGLVCANVMPVADGSGTCRKANGAQ